MVSAQCNAYLFIGQDIVDENGASKKEIALNNLKNRFLPPALKDFNLDILHAKGLNLKELQEKLLLLPLGSKSRMLVIRGCQDLLEETRAFILGYLKNPDPRLILVFDTDEYEPKDKFIEHLKRYARALHFRQEVSFDAFDLARSIIAARPKEALKTLYWLLEKRERPELILGGLRYALEKNVHDRLQLGRVIKFLLNCDIEIKTGRIKAGFALEKLVVALCFYLARSRV